VPVRVGFAKFHREPVWSRTVQMVFGIIAKSAWANRSAAVTRISAIPGPGCIRRARINSDSILSDTLSPLSRALVIPYQRTTRVLKCLICTTYHSLPCEAGEGVVLCGGIRPLASCPCSGTNRESHTADNPACAPCTRSAHAGSASDAHPA